MPMDGDFLGQLRALFVVEAREHLQHMSGGLLQAEATGVTRAARAELLQTVFRAAHSLKGAARAVELVEMEGICQVVEDVLALWRDHPPTDAFPAGSMDALHRAMDMMGAMLDTVERGEAPGIPPELPTLRRQLRRFGRGGAGEAPGAAASGSWLPPARPAAASVPAGGPAVPRPSPAPAAMPAQAEREPPAVRPDAPEAAPAATASPPPGAAGPAAPAAPAAEPRIADTVRVALPKLSAHLLGAEEMIAAKLAAGQRVRELAEFGEWLADWRKAWSAVEPEVQRLRSVEAGAVDGDGPGAQSWQRVAAFLEWNNDAVHAMEGRLAALGRAVRHDRDNVGKLVDDLLAGAKQLLLLPFSTLTASFAKLVRDLCRDQGKQADFTIVGEHIEIDKLILEEMKDPLIHMLRNAVDHGIEAPEERERAGKPARARIRLEVSHLDGSRVQIVLSDDGGGILPERVREVAVKRGLVSAEEAGRADAQAVMQWVFRAELSTREVVSRVSGRGLGLSIALERARRLGGDAVVSSVPGQGTTFRIVLPAGRATYRGVLCEAGGQQFLIATAAVERVLRARREEVRGVEGHDSLVVDGRVVGVVRLADALGAESGAAQAEAAAADALQLLLIGKADQAIAFEVDRVLDEQEVLVKPLRRPLVHVRNIEAAAVLGNGRIVPILHVADLLRSARRVAGRQARSAADAPRPGAAVQRRLLVAEDSITSRMLIKSILESAGYAVTTAVDGLDAYSLLRTGDFELLVSDVEMPRLNGFDLTARVRADRRLRDLPVVLVTALETRADRERGVDVGANAYIVKGSFDQNNLLATVERFL